MRRQEGSGFGLGEAQLWVRIGRRRKRRKELGWSGVEWSGVESEGCGTKRRVDGTREADR